MKFCKFLSNSELKGCSDSASASELRLSTNFHQPRRGNFAWQTDKKNKQTSGQMIMKTPPTALVTGFYLAEDIRVGAN